MDSSEATRSYFEEHPTMYALSVVGAAAATIGFGLRAVTARSMRARVRNAILASVAGAEVWGLIQVRRGEPIALAGPDD